MANFISVRHSTGAHLINVDHVRFVSIDYDKGSINFYFDESHSCGIVNKNSDGLKDEEKRIKEALMDPNPITLDNMTPSEENPTE